MITLVIPNDQHRCLRVSIVLPYLRKVSRGTYGSTYVPRYILVQAGKRDRKSTSHCIVRKYGVRKYGVRGVRGYCTLGTPYGTS